MICTCVFIVFGRLLFFFFKQKTAYDMRISDWSSDVCSSDLGAKQTAGSLGRSAGHRRLAGRMRRLGTRQAEKAARLVEHLAEGVEPAIESDQIEEIAMLAGGGVGPFAGRAGTGLWSRETELEAPAGGVQNNATQHIAALAAAGGAGVAANGIGSAPP